MTNKLAIYEADRQKRNLARAKRVLARRRAEAKIKKARARPLLDVKKKRQGHKLTRKSRVRLV